MVLTPSTMLPLGTRAPDFALVDSVSGRTVKLADFAKQKVLVVMFLCNHCPYVKHVRDGLTAFGRDYDRKEVGIVAISANDPEHHPGDAPEKIAEEARANGWKFPYLFDATQEVAKKFTAACTPDFFVFDAFNKLVYRGQFDASRPGNDVPVTGADLRAAVDAVLAKKPQAAVQRPSLGCNIKWRAGNEPNYFKPKA
ncbi:MAG: thioredoxin family protein [Planctomycetes bacterium]|nr:thioredoxin family protein [Planctomycetota bacterium]